MKYVISQCLLGENCKYNGGNNRREDLLAYLQEQGIPYVGVCPEVLGGLPIPRLCAEICDGRVLNSANQDVSEAFALGAQRAMEIACVFGADTAILQSRSPSCGVHKRYSGHFDRTLIDGNGIFAQLLVDHGFHVYDASEFMAEQVEHKMTNKTKTDAHASFD